MLAHKRYQNVPHYVGAQGVSAVSRPHSFKRRVGAAAFDHARFAICDRAAVRKIADVSLRLSLAYAVADGVEEVRQVLIFRHGHPDDLYISAAAAPAFGAVAALRSEP